MMNINYKNPMSRIYQTEYAMYLAISELFYAVRCSSKALTTLKLYFADLVTESKVTGTPNFRKQEEMMNELRHAVKRDLIGKIVFPSINQCMAQVTIIKNEDYTHSFTFSDGIYGFTVNIERTKKGGLMIIVSDICTDQDRITEKVEYIESRINKVA